MNRYSERIHRCTRLTARGFQTIYGVTRYECGYNFALPDAGSWEEVEVNRLA